MDKEQDLPIQQLLDGLQVISMLMITMEVLMKLLMTKDHHKLSTILTIHKAKIQKEHL
jgi:hypothetical protein